MRTPLAWRNITHQKLRTAASLTGVCFAIVLIFMQLGFYDTGFRASIMLFDQYDFDLAITSPHYFHFRGAFSFPLKRIYQAKAVPGVTRVAPLYVGEGMFRNPVTWVQKELVIMGVDPDNVAFRMKELTDQAHLLKKADTALMDTAVHRSYGPIETGRKTELEHRKIQLVGTYRCGSGFISDASIMVSEQTLANLGQGQSLDAVAFGLVSLDPSVDVEAARKSLVERLPADVIVWTRRELEKHEQNIFMGLKPLGTMFSSGVFLGFIVGSIILYQILSTEVMNRLKLYATLRAMGYETSFMVGVVVEQATIFAVLGYIPAVAISVGMYWGLEKVTNLPLVMTIPRLLGVFIMSVVMCTTSGLLASRKVASADPADLF
jgi:putative ABC transport system permease protein